jgi:heat shock protein HtpX
VTGGPAVPVRAPRAAAAGLRNVGKSLLFVGILAAAFAGLGWLVDGERGASLFGFCSLLAATGAYAVGDRALLGMLGARPLAVARHPGLRSSTDRIAAQVGIAAPKISVIEDGFPRAFVVGRGPRSSTLVVSRGLLGALPSGELHAVLAHELWHVRCRDVLTQTFAVLVATTLVETSRVGGWLARGLLYLLGPVAAAFTHLLLSPRRELAADAAAASVAGWENIADALLRLDRASDLVQFEASVASEPLYTVSPFDTDDRLSRMFVTHPPLQRRIDALRSAGLEAEHAGGEPAAPA